MADRYGRILYFIVDNPKDLKYFGFPIKTKYPIDNNHPVTYTDVVSSIQDFLYDISYHRTLEPFWDHIKYKKAYDRLRFSKNLDKFSYNPGVPMKITVYRNYLRDLKLEWETIESLKRKKYTLIDRCATILAEFLQIFNREKTWGKDIYCEFIIPCEPSIYPFVRDVPNHQQIVVIPAKTPIESNPEDDFIRRVNMAFNLHLWIDFTEVGMVSKKENIEYAKAIKEAQEQIKKYKMSYAFPYSYQNYDPDEELALTVARSRMPLYGQGFFAIKPRITANLDRPEIFPMQSYIGWKLTYKPIKENPYRLVYKRECRYPRRLGALGDPNYIDGDDLLTIIYSPKEAPEPYFDLNLDDYNITRRTPDNIGIKKAEWRRRLEYKDEMKVRKSQLAIDINSVVPDFPVPEGKDPESRLEREVIEFLNEDRGREIHPYDTIFKPMELLKYYKSYGSKFEWGYYDLKFSIDHINSYISIFGYINTPLLANKIQNAIRNELYYILLFSGVNVPACEVITQNIISDPKYSLYDRHFFRLGLREFFPSKVRKALCQIMDDMMERIKSILEGSQCPDKLSHLIKK